MTTRSGPRTLGRFTAAELGVLAEHLSVAAWPIPFAVRVTVATQDDARAAAKDAEARLAAGGLIRAGRLDADLEEALGTLARPLRSLYAVGSRSSDPADLVRIVAAHRGGWAVLAHQLPGPSYDVGGDLVVQTTTWADLADDVAVLLQTLLPPVPAGRTPALTLGHDELVRDERVSINARRQRVDEVREQFDAARSSEIGTVGQLGVRASNPDGDMAHRVSLTWFDAVDDGRYLLESSAGAALTPCDTAALTRALADQLAREPSPAQTPVTTR